MDNEPEFLPAEQLVDLTPGDVVRISRELNEWRQEDLAEMTGIPQPAISGIETGRIKLGQKRAEILGDALGIHPAVILYPRLRGAAVEPEPSD